MEITDTSIVDTLRSHERIYSSQVGDTGAEWEMKILYPNETPWKQHHFQQVLQVLRGIPNIEEEVKEELLVVQAIPTMHVGSDGAAEFDNKEGHSAQTMLYVRGLPQISKYCYSNNCGIVDHEWRSEVVLASNRLQEVASCDIQSKVVQHITVVQEDVSGWADIPKYHILKKEFIYTEKSSPISYVVSMIRESSDVTPQMALSGVHNSQVRYEFGVMLKEGGTGLVAKQGAGAVAATTTKSAAERMMSSILRLHMLLLKEPVTVSKTVKTNVFDEYLNTIKPAYKRPDVNNRSAFLAPKPVTLEKKNMLPPGSGLGIITIQDGYTVTDKADGERMLLFIDSKGDAYFIDNMLKVRASGWKTNNAALHRTVIDGEYIPLERQHKPKEHRDIFAAFDIYFVGGRNVMGEPLLVDQSQGRECRYKRLSAALQEKLWVEQDEVSLRPVVLQAKRMIAANGAEMLAVCKTMLQDTESLPYEIDGLIFTPAALPVFGYYPDRPVQIGAGTAWDRVFKWKPEEMNTIDFLVSTSDQPGAMDHSFVVANDENNKPRKYARFEIYTGYRPASWEDITPFVGMKMRYDKEFRDNAKRKHEYEKRLFKPIPISEDGIEVAYIPLDKDGVARTMNGEPVLRDTIVEFAYDKNDKRGPGYRWKALRVRDDKTALYRRDQRIGGAANDFGTAMNIWRSIHEPVTYAMIVGDDKIMKQDAPSSLEEAVLGADDVYYARQVPREHCYSQSMLVFHNIGIKKMLYERMPHTRLLELACGKAGDLGRWREYGFNFVLGVDYARNNITSPQDGAYARMLDYKRGSNVITNMNPNDRRVQYMDVAFAVGDCAKPLHTGEAAGDDKESSELLQMVYGRKPSTATWFDKVAGKARRPFDAVACQFAIHYFFKNAQMLDGFLRNVSNNLSVGGVFVGTCMDGERVDALLRTSKVGVVQGQKAGSVVWAIMKNYQGDLMSTGSNKDPYGRWVDVYLEMTHQTIPEYLVHFSFLKQKAAEFGLELLESETFDVTFNKLRSGVPNETGQRNPLDKAILDLDQDTVQKQFSFLNRWFIFTKKAVGGRAR